MFCFFISNILELGLRTERGFLTENSEHKSEELFLIVSEFCQRLAVGIKMVCMYGLLPVTVQKSSIFLHLLRWEPRLYKSIYRQQYLPKFSIRK